MSATVAAPPARAASRGRIVRRSLAGGTAVFVGVEAVLLRDRLIRSFGAISRLSPGWLLAAVAATAVSMHFFGRTQRRMLLAGGTRVPLRRMVGLAYAANAISWTLPGGTVLSTGYVVTRLRSWGTPTAAAGFAVVASGALSLVTFATLALLCGVLGGPGAGASVLTVALAGFLTIAMVQVHRRRPGLLTAIASGVVVLINRITRRDRNRGQARLRAVVSDLSAIRPRRSDWVAGAGFAAANWIADLGCLVLSCRAVDASDLTLTVLLTAYVAGMTASSMSVVPGGIGIIDVAMILALSAGGAGSAAATAGVIVYRLVSCALPVAVGWIIWGRSASTYRYDDCHTAS